jgi:hypothetical protein
MSGCQYEAIEGEPCGATVEYQLVGIDEEGRDTATAKACGSGEDFFQLTAGLFASGAQTVTVMEWVES